MFHQTAADLTTTLETLLFFERRVPCHWPRQVDRNWALFTGLEELSLDTRNSKWHYRLNIKVISMLNGITVSPYWKQSPSPITLKYRYLLLWFYCYMISIEFHLLLAKRILWRAFQHTYWQYNNHHNEPNELLYLRSIANVGLAPVFFYVNLLWANLSK